MRKTFPRNLVIALLQQQHKQHVHTLRAYIEYIVLPEFKITVKNVWNILTLQSIIQKPVEYMHLSVNSKIYIKMYVLKQQPKCVSCTVSLHKVEVVMSCNITYTDYDVHVTYFMHVYTHSRLY